MSTPLLNENIEVNLKDLQNEYLNFSRNLGELKKYNEKVSICSKREFNQFKNDLESLQKSLIQNIAKINNISKNLKSQETTNFLLETGDCPLSLLCRIDVIDYAIGSGDREPSTVSAASFLFHFLSQISMISS